MYTCHVNHRQHPTCPTPGGCNFFFTVTNLPHCSSNVAIHHNDATRRCDGDVTLRRDFALSRHNRQRCLSPSYAHILAHVRPLPIHARPLLVRTQSYAPPYLCVPTCVRPSTPACPSTRACPPVCAFLPIRAHPFAPSTRTRLLLRYICALHCRSRLPSKLDWFLLVPLFSHGHPPYLSLCHVNLWY
jgi:hypothetical protein